ncbi:MAG: glutathione peroxidase [Pseudomonadota bacterium]
MLKRFSLSAGLLFLPILISQTVSAACPSYLDKDMRRLHAKDDVNLCALTEGKPALLINTASHCGFTPQFKGLEKLHKSYEERGLVVIGFASDSFNQEAASEEKAADVCFVNFGVSFTMLAPTPVKGSGANPVFKELSRQAGPPLWNFNKYLIDSDGQVIEHFDSSTRPNSKKLIEAIEMVL